MGMDVYVNYSGSCHLGSFPAFEVTKIARDELRSKWQKWLRGLEIHFKSHKITDNNDKKLKLLELGGFELQEVYYDLVPDEDLDPNRTPDNADNQQLPNDPYAIAIKTLSNYFAPKQHQVYERHLFCSLKPGGDEAISQFGQRALNQALKCKFGDSAQESRENRVIDIMIQYAPNELKEKLLEEEVLSLDKAMTMCKSYEAVKFQAKNLTLKQERIETFGIHKTFDNCSRCGREKHQRISDCPAWNMKCRKCGYMGHYAEYCRTRRPRESNANRRPFRDERQFTSGHMKRKYQSDELSRSKKRKVHKIESVEAESSDDEELTVFGVDLPEDEVVCLVGGVEIRMFIDGGSKYNMIDENTWDLLQARRADFSYTDTQTTKTFVEYGRNPLRVLAVFKTNLALQERPGSSINDTTFFVIQGGQQPLLGSVSAKALNVLRTGLECHAGVNVIKSEGESRIFPKMKSVKVTLPIDRTVTPVQQPLRRTPMSLIKPLKMKLNEMFEQGIIEKVSGYSPWVSPLVPVVKKNGDIRVCVDLRRVNEAIRREKHPLPTSEYIFAKIKGAA